MNIALIAHDEKKSKLVDFTVAYADILKNHDLYATGTTGRLIMEATGLNITLCQSGPMGGDQQIGSLVAQGKMDMILFLRDPLKAQPHEPDINALLRVCDVHDVPLATNLATAELLIKGLKRGDLDWRNVVRND